MKRIKKIKFSDHNGKCGGDSDDHESGWDHAIAVDQWENEKITITVTADELQSIIRNSTTEELRRRFDTELDEVIAKQMAFRDFCGDAIDQLDIKDTSEVRRLLKIPSNKKIFDGTVEYYREEFNLGKEEEEYETIN